MADMNDINKTHLSTVLPLEDARRLDKLAAEKGVTRSKAAASVIREGLTDIDLDESDYRWIADQIEKNRARREAKKGATK